MVHTFDPSDDFEPGFFETLGRLVAEFGRLEYILKLAVKRLRRVSFGEGMLAAEAMHLEPLGDEAKALFQQRVSDTHRKAEFVARVSEAIIIWEDRNDDVHCPLDTTKPCDTPVAVSFMIDIIDPEIILNNRMFGCHFTSCIMNIPVVNSKRIFMD